MIVFCNGCGANSEPGEGKKLKHLKQHLDHCRPKQEAKEYQCSTCGQGFNRKERFDQHYHNRVQKVKEGFVEYKWVGDNESMMDLVKDDYISRISDLCFNLKLSAPNFYPCLSVPAQFRRGQDEELDKSWTDYGNCKAATGYEKVGILK